MSSRGGFELPRRAGGEAGPFRARESEERVENPRPLSEFPAGSDFICKNLSFVNLVSIQITARLL